MAKMKRQENRQSGQALVEYALIVTLVILGFGIALAATGPAIANVFRNTVDQVVAGDRLRPGETPLVALDFWNTMTAVASITPGEKPLPTRTPQPPTFTLDPNIPTNTFTPTVPTNTPQPTPTATSTPTATDIKFVAPWTDSADDPKHWRLDNNLFVGQRDWYGQYFDNTQLSGSPIHSMYNAQLDQEGTYRNIINFDWGNQGPINSFAQQYFSVRWRRYIWIDDAVGPTTTLQFDIPRVNDGVRIWILGKSDDGTIDYGGSADPLTALPGNCSPTGITSGSTGTTNINYDDAYYKYNGTGNPPNHCLIVDRWSNGSASYYNVQRTVKPGEYVIVVEYYESTGSANITVNMSSPSYLSNPDNSRIDDTGANTAGIPDCQWANIRNWNEADSPEFSWDEYGPGGSRSSNMPSGNKCYLELRGFIEIPDTMTNPVLTFWDLWNTGPGVKTWVEIGDYEGLRDVSGLGSFDNYGTWTGPYQTYDMHIGTTYNYNWSYQTIDLSNHPAVQPGGSRKVAIRFGISRTPSSSASNVRWWLDSIKLDQKTHGRTPGGDFYTALTWNLNEAAQANDFITSGHWALTNENGKVMNGVGLAWHESPNANYARLWFNNNNSFTSSPDFRAHWLEFDGWINLAEPLGMTDEDGDTGAQVLTFWHYYDLVKYTGLEIQYTTDDYSYGEQANWQVVPGGELVQRSYNGNSTNTIFEKVQIRLQDIGVSRFRLRFVMLVHKNASDPTRAGWYIDEIRLEREDRPKFTNYPFIDTAEDPANQANFWLSQGPWARVAGGHLPAEGETGFTYTDSPDGDYAHNSKFYLELKAPFDMRLDTPQNPKSPACSLGALCETPSDRIPFGENPVMTFWWRRELGGADDLYVEWKRRDEDNDSWRVLWAYLDRMTTNGGPSATDSETRVQLDWERVEISFQPILNAIAADDTSTANDDDIVLRFYFVTNNSLTSVDDGIYIDDIKVDNKVEDVWHLWPATESRTDHTGTPITTSSGAPIFGSGSIYSDSLENNPNLFTGGWHYGGRWSVINWMQKDGLLAFHDNAEGKTQTQAEPYHDIYANLAPSRHDTFSVLEMDKIIDLRGVPTTARPSLYFWTRYAIGRDDFARVQISYEDPTLIGTLCANGYAQCYEKQYGWSEWETVWEVGNIRNLTWNRIQLSLERYAKTTTTPGRRIRIRFVLDAYRRDEQRDGWYIDGIVIRPYDAGKTIVIRPGSSFFDGARNLNNWMTEGRWGLDPEFYHGSGGGPASLGSSTWNYTYWNMRSPTNRCSSIPGGGDFKTCADKFLSEFGSNRAFREADSPSDVANPGGVPPTRSGIVLDINNEWGNSGPFGMTDNFIGRWYLDSGIVGVTVQPGVYTFIGASDDGQRLRYITYQNGAAPGGQIPGPCSAAGSPAAADEPLCGQKWNIINDWNYHGRTVQMGTARLVAAGASIQVDTNGDGTLENVQSNSTGVYRFILEYFESGGGAVMTLSTGSNAFSFSDSPKQGVGLLFPDIEAVPRSSSSLVLNGTLDLSQAVRPYIQYYTVYELGGNARVEISTDGGFSWTQNGLSGSIPPSFWASPTWTGSYYANKTLSGSKNDHASLAVDKISYNFGGNPPFSGAKSDNFSISWTRTITLPNRMELTFRTRADDGVRLWLNYPGAGGCADGNGNVVVSGQATTNGGNKVFPSPDGSYDTPTTYSNGCLLIDNWRNQGPFTAEVKRTMNAGTYTLRLDYFENTGGAEVSLDIIPPGFDSPTYSGTRMPDAYPNWVLKTHDLSAYAGLKLVVIRFRLDRLDIRMRDEGRDPQNSYTQNPINWLESWWFSDITIADGG